MITTKSITKMLKFVSCTAFVSIFLFLKPASAQSIFCSPQQSGDRLEQVLCTAPQLSGKANMYLETLSALLWQAGPAGSNLVAQEATKSEYNITQRCLSGLPEDGNPSGQQLILPDTVIKCISNLLGQQLADWQATLPTAGQMEVERSISSQVLLQDYLQVLGFLPSNFTPSGVFNTLTRNAIVQWQQSVGRKPTGFLGSNDVAALATTIPASGPSIQTFASYIGIPQSLQGVWNTFCQSKYQSESDVYGPSLLLNEGGLSSRIVVSIETNNFYILSGTSYQLNGPYLDIPQYYVTIFQRISPNEIHEIASFTYDDYEKVFDQNSFDYHYDLKRCSSGDASPEDLTALSTRILPSNADVTYAVKAINNMPPVYGIKWNAN